MSKQQQAATRIQSLVRGHTGRAAAAAEAAAAEAAAAEAAADKLFIEQFLGLAEDKTDSFEALHTMLQGSQGESGDIKEIFDSVGNELDQGIQKLPWLVKQMIRTNLRQKVKTLAFFSHPQLWEYIYQHKSEVAGVDELNQATISAMIDSAVTQLVPNLSKIGAVQSRIDEVKNNVAYYNVLLQQAQAQAAKVAEEEKAEQAEASAEDTESDDESTSTDASSDTLGQAEQAGAAAVGEISQRYDSLIGQLNDGKSLRKGLFRKKTELYKALKPVGSQVTAQVPAVKFLMGVYDRNKKSSNKARIRKALIDVLEAQSTIETKLAEAKVAAPKGEVEKVVRASEVVEEAVVKQKEILASISSLKLKGVPKGKVDFPAREAAAQAVQAAKAGAGGGAAQEGTDSDASSTSAFLYGDGSELEEAAVAPVERQQADALAAEGGGQSAVLKTKDDAVTPVTPDLVAGGAEEAAAAAGGGGLEGKGDDAAAEQPQAQATAAAQDSQASSKYQGLIAQLNQGGSLHKRKGLFRSKTELCQGLDAVGDTVPAVKFLMNVYAKNNKDIIRTALIGVLGAQSKIETHLEALKGEVETVVSAEKGVSDAVNAQMSILAPISGLKGELSKVTGFYPALEAAKAAEAAEEALAATNIQSIVRGRQVRVKAKAAEEAATNIQRLFRGNQGRKAAAKAKAKKLLKSFPRNYDTTTISLGVGVSLLLVSGIFLGLMGAAYPEAVSVATIVAIVTASLAVVALLFAGGFAYHTRKKEESLVSQEPNLVVQIDLTYEECRALLLAVENGQITDADQIKEIFAKVEGYLDKVTGQINDSLKGLGIVELTTSERSSGQDPAVEGEPSKVSQESRKQGEGGQTPTLLADDKRNGI